MRRRQWATAILSLCLGARTSAACFANEPGLVLERTISLGGASGRIDHLAIDVARKRLFVSKLGANSVVVVDLESGKVIRQIDGLPEPQGIGYSPGAEVVAIANAGDGSVRLFRADDLTPAGEIALGDNADNIRTDGAGQLVVGYGSGGLATLDTGTSQKVGDIRLPAHPEGFQIDPSRNRIYVNLPTAYQIGVIDASTGKVVAKWGPWLALGNFPMALDDAGHRLFSGYRWPASVVAIDTTTGAILNQVSACGDSDDMSYDGARKRLYVSCGDGRVAIFDAAAGLSETARVSTRAGARTSLFVLALDRLFVAVPSVGDQPAEIQTFAPR
jgi:DNA-binding beta-propeller fold protein YncE